VEEQPRTMLSACVLLKPDLVWFAETQFVETLSHFAENCFGCCETTCLSGMPIAHSSVEH
jgi:hypothetical protein